MQKAVCSEYKEDIGGGSYRYVEWTTYNILLGIIDSLYNLTGHMLARGASYEPQGIRERFARGPETWRHD